ncbi:MAG: FAS1-like dehydratase domain-containing protein [Nocardioidaceae bacterium]
MPVNPQLAGRSFPPTPPYEVSAAKIAEFSAAIGAANDADAGDRDAPPTFPIVVAFGAMTDLMSDPEVGINLQNVVHADQRFEIGRPVRAGDVLTATLTVDSVRRMAGTDIIATRSEITTADGEHVCTAYATLAHRSPEEATA